MNICVPVKASMRLHTNGKATIQGKTNSEMEKALEKFVEILRELGYDTKSKPCYLVTKGSLATADMGGAIDVEKFRILFGGTYKKNGTELQYETFSRKLIICESGKIIIFKASSLDEMNIAFDEAYPKLQHCMK